MVDFMGVDFIVWLIMALPPLLIMMIAMYEMMQRSKYPIRARIYEGYGSMASDEGKRSIPVVYEDRLGFVSTKDKKGVAVGGKHWQLRSAKGLVPGFDKSFVYESYVFQIPFLMPKGYRKALFCDLNADNGKEGLVFSPIKIDPEFREPLVTAANMLSRSMALNILEERTRSDNWLKDHMMQIAIGIFGFVICALLFMCFMQLADIAKSNASAGASWGEATRTWAEVMTGNTTRWAPKMNETKPGQTTPGQLIPFLGQ